MRQRLAILMRRHIVQFLALCIALMCADASAQTVTFRQINSATPQTPQSTVTVAYTAAQTAGNLNVVAIGWSTPAAAVTGVSDSRGNVYTVAAAPTVQSGVQAQVIYIAPNIGAAAANANTVTVTFSAAVAFPDVRIVEYSGLDLVNPLDSAAGAVGSGTTSSSGNLTTTSANGLLVGANYVTSVTTAAGSGYTSRRITQDGSILEDRVVTATGTYSATATILSGNWVMQVVALRAAGGGGGGDTQPPTIPLNVVATAGSSSQIALTWTASTDNIGVTGYRVERCQNAGCTTFTQVGTPTVASFSDTGLAASTSYSYRVRATDAAGNLSGYSAVATAVTLSAGDTQPPTVPGTVVAAATSSSRISVTWTASTDNVGVTGYRVERCQGPGCTTFSQVSTPNNTTFNNTGLSQGTSYSYRVRARDAAGNLSGYSAVVTALTFDTQVPTVPLNIVATATSSTQINVTWTASTDNVGVNVYRVERCQGVGCTSFVQVAAPATPSLVDAGLTAATTYRYRVRATDAAGNLSGYSTVATATTLTGPDIQPPSVPVGVVATPASSNSQITVGWTASTDNVGVTGYQVERCEGTGCASFVPLATPTSTSFIDTGLPNATSFSYRIRATDAAGNLSGYSSTASATTVSGPHLVINQPTQGASVVGATVNVAYSATGDLTGVDHVHFQLDANSVVMDLTFDGIYQFSNVPAGAHTLLGYMVRANHTAIPNTDASVTFTNTGPDVEPPTAPNGLVGTPVSTAQINLIWTASTDNAAVTGYQLERCEGAGCTTFAQVGTPTGTSFGDSGLTAATSYSYRVRATDAAGNLSGYSTVVTATTTSVATPIAFVQINSATPQTPQSTVNVPYTALQTAGNLNVVAIGWSTPTAVVTGVSDSRGNVYDVAAGLTVQAGVQAQVMYIAPNIGAAAASANVVTVTFNTAVAYPDVRIVEYSGLDLVNPLDGAAGAVGAGTTSNSGTVTPPSANVLLVGANYVTSVTTAAGTGYTSRKITEDGSILEDRIVTAAGTYSATAAIGSGNWVMQVVALRGAASGGGGDTLAPTVPVNVAATATSGSQITVTWTASTDNVAVTGYRVERCQGVGCTTFTQVGTPTTANFSDTGLSPATSYSYRVRATDAASNLSGYSVVTTTTTPSGAPDSQAPTVPVNLVATPASNSQINLTWTASTDNVGVTGYRVERCQGMGCTVFAQVATPTVTSHSDTGLAAGTIYSYRVRATDAAGNLSGYSTVATATTTSGAPTITFRQINSATPQTPQSTVTVAFTAAQTAGNLNLVAIGWSSPTAAVTGVSDNRGNVYSVAAGPTLQSGTQGQVIYVAPNIGAAAANANVVTVTFSTAVSWPDVRVVEYSGLHTSNPVDNTAGAVGSGTTSNSGTVTTTSTTALLVGANTVTSVTTGAGSGYTSRKITPNGNILEDRIVTSAGSYSATAPISSGSWVMQVVALRPAPTSGDIQPPTAPVNVVPTASSSSQVAVTWTASTDDVAVTGYRVERCQGVGCTTFTQVGAPAATSFSDTGLLGNSSYTYRVRAIDAAGNLSGYSSVASVSTPPTPPPAIFVSTPGSGATVTGTVTLGVTVTDGNPQGVQFQIDGANVGPAVGAPYFITFNTQQFSNGTHAIGAYAWDSQRTVGIAAPIQVTLSNANAGNPAQTGLWSGLFSWPLVSVHISMLKDGRVLAWDRFDSGNPDPQVWDPLTSRFTSAPTNDGADLFCAGQAILPDGRFLAVGGNISEHVGLNVGRIFNPSTNLWTSAPNMSYGRWYPTATSLPDGRVLVMSGELNCYQCYANIPEIYDPQTNNWATLPSASLSMPWYPHAFVLPDGRIAVAGTSEAAAPAWVLNLQTQTWSTVDSRSISGYSSAMYLPGKILKTGSSTDSLSGGPSSAQAWVLDMTVPAPQWRQTNSMAFPRAYHIETLLPDGTILVTGGGRTLGDYDVANAVYQAELWSPATETFTTLASMQAPRLYHGTALLLPDGRVLVSGGGRSPGPDPRDQESAEIFAPPYLFKGPRPVIASAPAQSAPGQNFVVSTPDAARVAKVALVALGTMTHGFNMSQRYVPLTFTVTGNQLTVSAPASANLAPPGQYMLFLIDTNGVPSVASIMRF